MVAFWITQPEGRPAVSIVLLQSGCGNPNILLANENSMNGILTDSEAKSAIGAIVGLQMGNVGEDCRSESVQVVSAFEA